jgi:hypothetical protein
MKVENRNEPKLEMKSQSNMLFIKDAPFKELIANFSIILGGIILMLGAFTFMELKSALTLLLLVGTWLFDGFIKHTYGFKNETLFADFSFGAFAFSSGQSINMLSNSLSETNIATLFTLLITAALAFVWFGNLSICKYLLPTKPKLDQNRALSVNRYRVAWAMSCFLAILSCFGALYPQFSKII